MSLVRFADGIWTHEQDLSVFGVELGCRMTVVDLGNRQLWVHSPIRLTTALIHELKSLGDIRYVIAPNRWHHLFLDDFREYFPNAKYFAAPGLEQKRRDFPFHGSLKDEAFPWSRELSQVFIQGSPMYNETVFFHIRSRTLILTDLAVHICQSRSWRTRSWLRLLGSYGKFGWSRVEKFLFIKDRNVFEASIAKVMEWDFDKIILSHGNLIAENGKEIFRKAFPTSSPH